MSFGDRLRMLRTERGLTQQQLADKFNYKKSSISGYEREERKPPLDFVGKLADHFSVSVDYMLGRTDIRSINIPKEFIEGIEYAQEKGIPPEDLKVIIETFEQIKPILDKLKK